MLDSSVLVLALPPVSSLGLPELLPACRPFSYVGNNFPLPGPCAFDSIRTRASLNNLMEGVPIAT